MIRLTRPTDPAELAAVAEYETLLLLDQWAHGQDLDIKPQIYNCQAVKSALKTAQNNKCAYCETANIRSHDVVEHYRPKLGWRNIKKDKLVKPGYFWLAYDWNNLLFACDMCNDAGHKQNIFTITNHKTRATPPAFDVSKEKPLLIDPYTEDPEDHIEWSQDLPREKNASRKGRVTIDVFKLDYDTLLVDARRSWFNLIKMMIEAAEEIPLGNHKRTEIKALLQARLNEKRDYSAMIKFNFSNRISNLAA
jgi:uncharacterized protein (TIGR02646 family)